MNNIIWCDSFEEYDFYNHSVVDKNFQIFPVKSYYCSSDRNEYDLDLDRPYIGIMAIDGIGDRHYHLLGFNTITKAYK